MTSQTQIFGVYSVEEVQDLDYLVLCKLNKKSTFVQQGKVKLCIF